MMELLKPFLMEEKFKSIPKLILTQFCRGKSLESTMETDALNTDLSTKVNAQE